MATGSARIRNLPLTLLMTRRSLDGGHLAKVGVVLRLWCPAHPMGQLPAGLLHSPKRSITALLNAMISLSCSLIM